VFPRTAALAIVVLLAPAAVQAKVSVKQTYNGVLGARNLRDANRRAGAHYNTSEPPALQVNTIVHESPQGISADALNRIATLQNRAADRLDVLTLDRVTRRLATTLRRELGNLRPLRLSVRGFHLEVDRSAGHVTQFLSSLYLGQASVSFEQASAAMRSYANSYNRLRSHALRLGVEVRHPALTRSGHARDLRPRR
jgi:hypothetical protein